MNLGRLAALLLTSASCGRCGREPEIEIPPPVLETPRRDGGPAAEVRAYPPHAIRADGVGPYVLGQDLKRVLRALPEGPNLELFQLGRHANWRVARAEGGAIAIGADAENVVRFVSVLGPEVARTSAGVGVGARAEELAPALGPPDEGLAVVRDRPVWTFPSLPTVAFLGDGLDEPRVLAVVVAERRETPPRRAGCAAGPSGTRDEIVAAARAGKAEDARARVAAGCVSGQAAEAVVLAGGELVLVGGEAGKLKRLGAAPVTADGFVGLLDIDGEPREEIVTGAQGVVDGEHQVTIQVHRWENGKLATVLTERPFVIGAAAAAGAGVVPAEIELVVEARGGRGELEVGGVYLARRDGALRGAAPVTPVTLKVEPRRAAAEPRPAKPTDAGPPDAAGDAGED
jgi:hypothetical protein